MWIAAGAAVFLVVALVIALALANDAIKKQTAVPPLPAMPESSSEFPTPPPSTRTPPSRTRVPMPPPGGSQTPTETPTPGAMQDVVYTVTGDGRALSIMYIATGDVVQTEFNVALPWSKEVSLAKSAVHPAAVTIVNFGHNVTCSVTVGGVQVSQRVGVGLTICDARGLSPLQRSGRRRPHAPDADHQHPEQSGDQDQRDPPRPARTAPKASTKTENSHGATNDTARPVIV